MPHCPARGALGAAFVVAVVLPWSASPRLWSPFERAGGFQEVHVPYVVRLARI